jgi:hypothetical protein
MEYTGDDGLPQVSAEEFQDLRNTAKPYTVMILKAGPEFVMPGADRDSGVTGIIMEHGLRNARLLRAGLMPIICPIADGSGITGIGVFNATPDDVQRIMDADPGVQAGVFTYEIHPSRSFPGSSLP